MKTVRDVIRRAPVWVSPEHSVESAIILMRGHNIGCLPVVDGSDLIGMVTNQELLGQDLDQRISTVMRSTIPSLPPDISVREAADDMVRLGVSRMAVVDADRLIGIVTDGDLLPEIGRSIDPLTELPWSNAMREWAIDHFKQGSEITVLFIDIDRFGLFNKQHGHIIGDEVLQEVADALQEVTNPDLDLLCRYGGDEFCIATLRWAEEATKLADQLTSKISAIKLPSLPEGYISCHVGQYGGKRTKEREHTHYAATLNNLINLASQDCTAKKNKHQESTIPIDSSPDTVLRPAAPRMRLVQIDMRRFGKSITIEVSLEIGKEDALCAEEKIVHKTSAVNRFSASKTCECDEHSLLKIVAETTVTALRLFLPDNYDVILSDVLISQLANTQSIVTAVGSFVAGSEQIPIAGSAIVTDEPYRAAARAVLASANRCLGLIAGK
jgi:IMP dehydrogenase